MKRIKIYNEINEQNNNLKIKFKIKQTSKQEEKEEEEEATREFVLDYENEKKEALSPIQFKN